MSILVTLAILLLAAVVMVPLTKRFGMGGILGYLLAGALVGPAGLGLVSDIADIAEVSELGIVMLLFLIGLEIRPARLWTMRRLVFGLGGAQILLTGAVIAAIGIHLGYPATTAAVVGFGLALSSTALVLPLLAERGLITADVGRASFAMLLFQDLAVIPVLAALPLLAGHTAATMTDGAWLAVLKAVVVLAAVFLIGRFAARFVFRILARVEAPEVFTAAALLLVIGTAAVVGLAGLSASLGAFVAGVILSDSEYRHELRADIEPFESLLLGFFFISIGMAANLAILAQHPLAILATVAGLIALKTLAVGIIGPVGGLKPLTALRAGIAIGQGGEFAFVLFAAAAGLKLIDAPLYAGLLLVITLSIAATPPLFAASEWTLGRLRPAAPKRPFDRLEEHGVPVIICGFQRVGQIVGRILRLRHVPFVALESDAVHVDFVRKFGNQVFYGDATRVDLLRLAGAAEAKIIVVALENIADSLKVVETVRRHFPHLKVIASAVTRRHAHLLMGLGIEHIVRETFHSSLVLTEKVLAAMGEKPAAVRRLLETFREHDETNLRKQFGFRDDQAQMIQNALQTAAELESLFEQDTPQAVAEKD